MRERKEEGILQRKGRSQEYYLDFFIFKHLLLDMQVKMLDTPVHSQRTRLEKEGFSDTGYLKDMGVDTIILGVSLDRTEI